MIQLIKAYIKNNIYKIIGVVILFIALLLICNYKSKDNTVNIDNILYKQHYQDSIKNEKLQDSLKFYKNRIIIRNVFIESNKKIIQQDKSEFTEAVNNYKEDSVHTDKMDSVVSTATKTINDQSIQIDSLTENYSDCTKSNQLLNNANKDKDKSLQNAYNNIDILQESNKRTFLERSAKPMAIGITAYIIYQGVKLFLNK